MMPASGEGSSVLLVIIRWTQVNIYFFLLILHNISVNLPPFETSLQVWDLETPHGMFPQEVGIEIAIFQLSHPFIYYPDSYSKQTTLIIGPIMADHFDNDPNSSFWVSFLKEARMFCCTQGLLFHSCAVSSRQWPVVLHPPCLDLRSPLHWSVQSL